MPASTRPSAHTRILDAADRLFYGRGVQAVGVEAIVAAADTAKTTLYGHFGSKDALVVAYLERRAARERERLEHGLAAHGGTAAERLLHVYDLLAEELADPGYRGSAFVNACVELGNDQGVWRVVAEKQFEWLPIEAFLRPLEYPLVVRFEESSARYLRLTNAAPDQNCRWLISEIAIW